ncbi:MAG TPA: hypothetical protein VFG69_10480, partial [Nannocystaceae bacterium]|nr:hypothetical protein [Nannocystaceae bacterium]
WWCITGEQHDDPRGRDLVAIDGPADDGDYVGLRGDGELVRWTAGEWQRVGRHDGAKAVTIAARGDRVVTSGASGLISWSLATGESQRLRDRLDEVALMQPPIVDPQGRWVALHREGSSELVDLSDGSSRTLDSQGMCFHFEFAPDEPRFYVGCITGSHEHLRRWDTATWQELPLLPLSGHFLGVGPRGRIAVRERDRVVVDDIATPGDPTALALGFVTRARFAGDGRTIVGLATDGHLVIGDVSTARVGHLGPRLRFREQTAAELQTVGKGLVSDDRRFAFSRDGTRVLVIDGDGALQRSRPLPPASSDELRAWVHANAPALPSSVTLDRLVPDPT